MADRMLPRLSAREQAAFVIQGLALGVLAHDVDWIADGKPQFEAAFSCGWQAFPSGHRFHQIVRIGRADPYFLLERSVSCQPPFAAWRPEGSGWRPYVWHRGWTVRESGEMLARWSSTRWDEWESFASEFVEHYRRRGLLAE